MYQAQALCCDEKAERGEKHAETHHDSKAWILACLELKRRLKELIVFEREGISDLHACYFSAECFSADRWRRLSSMNSNGVARHEIGSQDNDSRKSAEVRISSDKLRATSLGRSVKCSRENSSSKRNYR